MSIVSHQNFHVAPPTDPGGTFADFVLVWQTGDMFVLDFAAIVSPPDPPDEDDQQDINTQVVSRVRIPPSQVFEIMKALEQQLSQWEARTGNVPTQVRESGEQD